MNQVFEPPEKTLETFCRGGIYPALVGFLVVQASRLHIVNANVRAGRPHHKRAGYVPPLHEAGGSK